MKKFGIGYLVPESASQYQLNLRQKIQTRFNLTGSSKLKSPSHITLKYPFQAEETQAVEQLLQRFSATQPQTKWAIRGFNYFQNGETYVIYMDVIASLAARKAHEQLLEALHQIEWMEWGEFDTADMHYHVTVAQKGLTKHNFDTVWAFVNRQTWPNFDLHFDNVALVQLQEGVGTIIGQYWLSKDKG
ncbi:MAG: 2'-5' RNA ligase family protein [Chloroflexota bacterium]